MMCDIELIPYSPIQAVLGDLLDTTTQAEFDNVVASLESFIDDSEDEALVATNIAYWLSRQADDPRALLAFDAFSSLELTNAIVAPALAEYRCACDSALRENVQQLLSLLLTPTS